MGLGWAQEPNLLRRMSLDGIWNYQPIARTVLQADGKIAEDTSNLPPAGNMPVPSNWHLNGLPNFNGRVKFTRDFNFTPALAPTQHAFLVLHGVDYFAEIGLNGSPVGKHAGYFQSFEFDVTSLLKPGRNQLAITVDAPLEEPGRVWPDHKWMIKGLLSDWDCKPGSISMKTGQDGTTAGIWNSVEIEVRDQAWLAGVQIHPFLFRRGLAAESGAPSWADGPSAGDVLYRTEPPPEKPEDAELDAKIYISTEVLAAQPGRYEVTAYLS